MVGVRSGGVLLPMGGGSIDGVVLPAIARVIGMLVGLWIALWEQFGWIHVREEV